MPASRYVYNLAQRSPWSHAQSRAELIADLQESRPAAIFVEHGDRFPFLTGSPGDSAEALRDFPELRTMIQRDYRLVGALGKFDTYSVTAR